jgi:pimeloyl-ACP methyl ester carboxylesterase
LLLNAGAIHHIGPSRLYVTLARAWAAEGHTVLRLDLSGIGDSGTRPGQADNLVYSPHAGADVATAVRHLRAQPGVSRVVILGLCSGAYHGFKAAVAGEPIFAIVPINPLTFFWKEGMSLDFPAHKVAEESHRYAESALRLESWKKLARGEVHVRVLTQVLARRALSLVERHWRDLARQLGRPRPDDLGSELEALAARKIAVDFVFADGDPGMELLPLQGGSVVPRLLSQGKLRAHVITGPDHTFTARWSHPVLAERLTSVIRSHARAAVSGGGGGGSGGGRRDLDRGDA